jgi:lactate permease
MPWPQNYDPLGSVFLSTAVATLPVVVLLGALAFFRVRAHVAAMLALAVALVVALGPIGMPASLPIRASR